MSAFENALREVLPPDLLAKIEAEHADNSQETDELRERADTWIHTTCFRSPVATMEADLEQEYAERVKHDTALFTRRLVALLWAWKDEE